MRRRPHSWLVLFLMALLGGLGWARPSLSAEPPVTIGPGLSPLNGPWRFHVGDDPAWSSPSFDDHAWERVDLTPPPGAHDGDVGLPGYVPGWGKRGHEGYTGYAWYRLEVTVDNTSGQPLALAGPTLVDSAYQLYLDGQPLGSSGDFSGATPTVYGVRPSVFPLPAATAHGTHTLHLALRVWMDPLDAAPESGGVHVAPVIGTTETIDHLNQVQWWKTFTGYVVDAAEPLAFVVLTIMVFALMACDTGCSYGWMATALIALALLRVNQVLFYWTPWLSLHHYDFVLTVLLRPFVLLAWALAWKGWLQQAWPRWLGPTAMALTVVYFAAALLGRPWLVDSDAVGSVSNGVVSTTRIALSAIYIWVIVLAVARAKHVSDYLAALSAVLVGVGIFATELNLLGIPGIWFPYGVGVARGQYAYAAFIPLFFGLVLVRLGRSRRLRT